MDVESLKPIFDEAKARFEKCLEVMGFDQELRELAEKRYAAALALEVQKRGEVGRQMIDSPLGRKAFLLGFAAALANLSESALEDEVLKWQMSWMHVEGTNEQDRKNYFERSAGIDANMRFNLARRLLTYLRVSR